MKISSKKLDKLYEKVVSIPEYDVKIYGLNDNQFKANDWCPSKDRITYILENEFEEKLPFLLWFCETCSNTPEQKEIKSIINKFMYEHLNIQYDEKD